LVNKDRVLDNSQLCISRLHSFQVCNMQSAVAFAPGSERSSQSPFFSKLGDYFDRPEWWEEGAATLNAFFDEDAPPVKSFDQRLEDLLDSFEPLRVIEKPQKPTNAVETDLPQDNHVADAPAVVNNIEDLLLLPENRILVKPLSVLDVTTGNDATDSSSPVLTGTTTSTRQTSPRPRSSTRASSVVPDAGSFPDDELLATSTFEAPQLNRPLGTSTARHNETSTSVHTGDGDDGLLTESLAAVEDSSASLPLARVQDPVSGKHSGTEEELKPGSRRDPTGLQAIKDEFSDQNGLTTAIDSSILTQETDITVVHDPTLAAVSFFPPNPYSDVTPDFDLDTTENPSEPLDGKPGHGDEVDNGESSADSTLTSLASNHAQLPEDYREQLNDPERWHFRTPSPPPTSPLSPPRSWAVTRHIDQDAIVGADAEEDVNGAPPEITSTLSKPTIELGKASPSVSKNVKGLKMITEAANGLARNTGAEDQEIPTTSIAPLSGKRRQEESHSDEPSQKRRLRPSTRSEKQSEADAELILTSKDETIKGTSKTVQKGKNKAASKPTKRDSPDELAPASPDELADPSASKPFGLNKAPLSLAKPKLNRSTSTHSRAGKPVDTSAPLRKLVGVARATRAAVGNKELAGLLGASPPRKAEEKAKIDIGGRLRSQARTPGPDDTPNPPSAPVVPLAPISTSAPAIQDTENSTPDIADTSETDTPHPAKRKRPPGANLLGAQELKELGSTPILGTRTRARTATVEPTPEPVTAPSSIKPAPKRTRSNLNLAAPNSAEVAEISTQNTAVESAPEPNSKPTPAKRIRKPVVRSAAKPAASSPFALAAKSKGTPAASRKKAPTKQKAVEGDKDNQTPSAKSTDATTKRKRGDGGEESEKGATRASKRIAGAAPEGE
jgi:hypothetical protein